jgi:p38 MAP kinase
MLSSATDKLTGQKVAIKKILKPFSNAVLAKRTYRELRLLKYLKHDNVRSLVFREGTYDFKVISLRDVFISPSEDLCALRLQFY